MRSLEEVILGKGTWNFELILATDLKITHLWNFKIVYDDSFHMVLTGPIRVETGSILRPSLYNGA